MDVFLREWAVTAVDRVEVSLVCLIKRMKGGHTR